MPRAAGSERKQRQPRPERLREEAEKLRERLARIEAQEQTQAAERHIVVGRALLFFAEGDETFRAQLSPLIDRAVRDRKERKLLGLSPAPGRRGRTLKRGAEAEPERGQREGGAETSTER